MPGMSPLTACSRRRRGNFEPNRAAGVIPVAFLLSSDCHPAVIRLSSDCHPAVIRLSSDRCQLGDSRPRLSPAGAPSSAAPRRPISRRVSRAVSYLGPVSPVPRRDNHTPYRNRPVGVTGTLTAAAAAARDRDKETLVKRFVTDHSRHQLCETRTRSAVRVEEAALPFSRVLMLEAKVPLRPARSVPGSRVRRRRHGDVQPSCQAGCQPDSSVVLYCSQQEPDRIPTVKRAHMFCSTDRVR